MTDALLRKNHQQPPTGVTPVLRGLFITGTDTGVGKTEVAAALARLLADSGVAERVSISFNYTWR